MPIIQANLWLSFDQETEHLIYVITTNRVIRGDQLVMGAGAARQARERYPALAADCATRIRQLATADYGCLLVRAPDARLHRPGLAIFQVKRDYRTPAELDLIARSVRDLSDMAVARSADQFRINFPGIGPHTGRLSRTLVEPLLSVLPDNVIVCYL